MTIQEIKIVLEELSKRRSVFHSEADFQQELAFAIREKYNKIKIRLEIPFKIPNDLKNKALDILLIENEKSKIGIELKYPKAKLKKEFDDEVFSLAMDNNPGGTRYSFLHDIKRLEELIKQNKIHKGFVILLTNDKNIYSDTKFQADKNGEDRLEHLRLYTKRIIGEKIEIIAFNTTKKSPIPPPKLTKFYLGERGAYKEFEWIDYCSYNNFKYLLVEVN